MGLLLLPSLLPSAQEACRGAFSCTDSLAQVKMAREGDGKGEKEAQRGALLQMVAGNCKGRRGEQLAAGLLALPIPYCLSPCRCFAPSPSPSLSPALSLPFSLSLSLSLSPLSLPRALSFSRALSLARSLSFALSHIRSVSLAFFLSLSRARALPHSVAHANTLPPPLAGALSLYPTSSCCASIAVQASLSRSLSPALPLSHSPSLSFLHSHSRSFAEIPLPILSLLFTHRYEQGEVPWACDIAHSELDTCGCSVEYTQDGKTTLMQQEQ